MSISICTEVPIKSNLFLQIFLWLNVYEFSFWSILYGFQILYDISSSWNIQGIFVGLAFLLINICEFIRLYSGYAGNLKAQPVDLSRFLVMTPLVLIPLLLFLLITIKRFKFLLNVLTYILFGLMFLEFSIGIFTWHKLCAYQAQIYKIKRDIMLQKKNFNSKQFD